MSKYVFINAFAGKSKTSQRSFNRVTIGSISDDGSVRLYDLFTDGGALLPNQDKLRFGDFVEPSYKASDIPGGRSSLTGLEVVTPSPFFEE